MPFRVIDYITVGVIITGIAIVIGYAAEGSSIAKKKEEKVPVQAGRGAAPGQPTAEQLEALQTLLKAAGDGKGGAAGAGAGEAGAGGVRVSAGATTPGGAAASAATAGAAPAAAGAGAGAAAPGAKEKILAAIESYATVGEQAAEKGDFPTALKYYDACLRLIAQATPQLDAADAVQFGDFKLMLELSSSKIQRQLGLLDEAETRLRSVVTGGERRMAELTGDEAARFSDVVVEAKLFLVEVLLPKNKIAEAEPLLDVVKKHFQERYGLEDENYAVILSVESKLCVLKGEYEAGAKAAEAAAAKLRVTPGLGPTHQLTVGATLRHALCLHELGRFPEANEILDKAVEQYRARDPISPDTMLFSYYKGCRRFAQDDFTAAVVCFRDAVKIAALHLDKASGEAAANMADVKCNMDGALYVALQAKADVTNDAADKAAAAAALETLKTSTNATPAAMMSPLLHTVIAGLDDTVGGTVAEDASPLQAVWTLSVEGAVGPGGVDKLSPGNELVAEFEDPATGEFVDAGSRVVTEEDVRVSRRRAIASATEVREHIDQATTTLRFTSTTPFGTLAKDRGYLLRVRVYEAADRAALRGTHVQLVRSWADTEAQAITSAAALRAAFAARTRKPNERFAWCGPDLGIGDLHLT